VHIQADGSGHTPPPPLARLVWETRWANDTDGSALKAQPDKSQGRPQKSPGSNAHRPTTGLPNMRSPKSPYPGHPTLTAEPRTAAPGAIFMPRDALVSVSGHVTPAFTSEAAAFVRDGATRAARPKRLPDARLADAGNRSASGSQSAGRCRGCSDRKGRVSIAL
jgi:hypothetical protein